MFAKDAFVKNIVGEMVKGFVATSGSSIDSDAQAWIDNGGQVTAANANTQVRELKSVAIAANSGNSFDLFQDNSGFLFRIEDLIGFTSGDPDITGNATLTLNGTTSFTSANGLYLAGGTSDYAEVNVIAPECDDGLIFMICDPVTNNSNEEWFSDDHGTDSIYVRTRSSGVTRSTTTHTGGTGRNAEGSDIPLLGLGNTMVMVWSLINQTVTNYTDIDVAGTLASDDSVSLSGNSKRAGDVNLRFGAGRECYIRAIGGVFAQEVTFSPTNEIQNIVNAMGVEFS